MRTRARGFSKCWRSVAWSIALAVAASNAAAQHPAPEELTPAQGPAAPGAEPAPESEPAPQPPAGAPAPQLPPDEAATDELIGRLLSGGESPEKDDLRWLYSDLEEYAPTDLVGKPIPAPALPERGEGSRRVWDPRWRRFAVGNYILTGVAIAVAAGSVAIPTSPDRWRGKNSFDESVRDAIGIEDYPDGQIPRDISDVLLSLTIMNPLLVDSLVITYWYRKSDDVATQMALIDTEAMGLASAIQGLTSGFTSRERPYGRNCGKTIDSRFDDCDSSKRYRSFFSGHTALSFAGASVSCSNHIHHQVYGNGTADAIGCVAALTAAGVTGTMRVVGDQHYASDVIMGAGIGTLTGFGLPWLLHYGPLARVESGSNGAPALRLSLVPVSNGLGVGGQF